jgi:hypothetical protein
MMPLQDAQTKCMNLDTSRLSRWRRGRCKTSRALFLISCDALNTSCDGYIRSTTRAFLVCGDVDRRSRVEEPQCRFPPWIAFVVGHVCYEQSDRRVKDQNIMAITINTIRIGRIVGTGANRKTYVVQSGETGCSRCDIPDAQNQRFKHAVATTSSRSTLPLSREVL